MADVGGILRCLAELSPRGADRLDVTVGDFAWLGTKHWPFSATADLDTDVNPGEERLLLPSVHSLAQLDAIHGTLPILRLGWVYLSAAIVRGSTTRRVLVPLVERTVRLEPVGIIGRPRYVIRPLSPWDLNPLVTDERRADELEVDIPFGGMAIAAVADPAPELLVRLPRLRAWIRDVTWAMGLRDVSVRGPIDPRERRETTRPLAIIGFGIHAALDVSRLDLRSSLTGWATRVPVPTALDALYDDSAGPAPSPASPGAEPIGSPMLLTHAQEEVLRRARRERVVVVSGPPGTGKSHTAAAVALDAVARGERVLVATRSPEAADVLAGLLERGSGPDPVLFGGGVRATRLARLLSDGLGAPADTGAAARHGEAWEAWREAAEGIDRTLSGVTAWTRYLALAPEVPAHRQVAPAWFDPGADLDEARELLVTATARADRPGRRARKAADCVREHARASSGRSLDRLAEALRVAHLRDLALGAVPTVAEGRWAELDRSDFVVRRAYGVALAESVRGRVGPRQSRAVAALATALRAGRGQRRRHLRSVDTGSLLEALPLWVGTLGDIEELLPQVPAMFDLVVLDEASQIDQPNAAPGLLRAARAVVVGDPRQLRFVSFLADRDVEGAIVREGLTEHADRLDVRRVSAFDLAASAAPVTFLDEHFRGPPHLIGFSARRFYGGRLTMATAHPSTDASDLIELAIVDGERDASGVVAAEVDLVVDRLAAERDGGQIGTSLGVVTPFRAQAEAILARVRHSWTIEDIERTRLRIGTVHAFQGDERDVVLVAVGVGPDGDGLRFVEDPHLFNVMVTRARRRMVVATACPEPRPGLLHDYLRWASRPPVSAPVGGPDVGVDGWTSSLAAALAAGGVAHGVGYPVGRDRVDLVVGDGAGAIGVETAVHPGGPAAHRHRHLVLRRTGWRVVDAFPGRFEGDPYAAAVELATLVGQPLTPRR